MTNWRDDVGTVRRIEANANEQKWECGMFCQFAKVWGDLWRVLFDTYQPELHYMRGPGPKWHAKQ